MGEIVVLSERDEETVLRLLEIWQSAVEETHTFLPAGKIVAIRPQVRSALAEVAGLYGCRDGSGVLSGFLGVEAGKVEMLFVHADARGQGIGKQLLLYAMEELGAKEVDVNEQNTQGVGFYHHMGFHTRSRSPSDDQGRPYPILHLSLE